MAREKAVMIALSVLLCSFHSLSRDFKDTLRTTPAITLLCRIEKWAI